MSILLAFIISVIDDSTVIQNHIVTWVYINLVVPLFFQGEEKEEEEEEEEVTEEETEKVNRENKEQEVKEGREGRREGRGAKGEPRTAKP